MIEWGETYGTVFSVHLSDDGKSFREVGRITTGNGGSDSFWWRSTTSRYFRLTVHEASSPEGAIVNELKLRILNKDRMPIGQLERAALAGRGDLYPQSLLGRQVYWTALGEFDQAEEALFDEYGNLEPRRGSARSLPCFGSAAPARSARDAPSISQSLVDGSLPIPTVVVVRAGYRAPQRRPSLTPAKRWSEYRITNRSETKQEAARSSSRCARSRSIPIGSMAATPPSTPFASTAGRCRVNDRPYAAFSREPDVVDRRGLRRRRRGQAHREGAPTDRAKPPLGFGPPQRRLRIRLFPRARQRSLAFVVSSPMRDDVTPRAETPFDALRESVARDWRKRSARARSRSATRKSATRSRRRRRSSSSMPRDSPSSPARAITTAPGFATAPRRRSRCSGPGLIDEAKAYVVWYSKRIYENGLVPPILNVDGTVNRGYGSDIEFDAQGEFVGIAADVYRVSRDRAFLDAIFEPVVRATKFIEELCARTDASHGPATRFHGLLAPSISHEGYSNPSYSYWDDYFALSAWRNCEFLASRNRRQERCGSRHREGPGVRREPHSLHPDDGGANGDWPHPRLRRSR